jgi:glutamate-5-semialdehyde dehydrogenase
MVEVPVKIYIQNLLKKARDAARPLAALPGSTKDAALRAMADRLETDEDAILEANRQDVETVGKTLEGETNKDTIKQAVDRVRLTAQSLRNMADTVRRLADLPDPVGELTSLWTQPNGLQVGRVRMPIGVIAIISDLGPTVSVEMTALCVKAGNVAVLREGSEWGQSNKAIFAGMREAGERAGLPAGALSLIERPEREAALEIVRQTKLVDAVVPRGSAALRKALTEQTRIPILCNDSGVSTVYLDVDADLPLAQNVVVNSKMQEVGAFNAADTVIVHQDIARTLVPGLVRRLLDEFQVEVRGCKKTISLTGAQTMSGYQSAKEAVEEDWSRQFQSRTVAIKIVMDLDEALTHMTRYGPSHTATIVTRDYDRAWRFVREVDASAVLVNTTTRFHDGHELGLGGEVGIATGRLHVRGPIALEALTCQKYVVLGNGQLRLPHPVPTAYEDAIMLKRM